MKEEKIMGNKMSNQAIIKKGVTLATGQTDGMLNPEQSRKFMQMVFDDSSFLGELRQFQYILCIGFTPDKAIVATSSSEFQYILCIGFTVYLLLGQLLV